jgi:predicted nucleic acid-binding protein
MRSSAGGLRSNVLVDTGPLVALLNAGDRRHASVARQLALLQPPFITCEAVLAEATHLVRNLPGGRAALLEMVDEGFLSVGLQISAQSAELLTLVKRYASVPMSLADACMVRLAELNPRSPVWTFDSDFMVYRKNGRHVIALIPQ